MWNNPYFWILVASVVVASFSQILLKKAAMNHYDSFIREYLNPYVIVGYIMMFGSMFITIMAYTGLDFKNGPIVESLGYVIVMFLSLAFFKEKITKKKAMGTLVILAGIVVFYL